MKKLALLFCLLVSACFQQQTSEETAKQSTVEVKSQTKTLNFERLGKPETSNNNQPSLRKVADLFQTKTSHVQVEDSGVVVKVLADDNNGLRHQKFLVKIASGQTLLFAHNIDLASRLDGIKVGDEVQFRGEYIYNPKGGIVHWTHHDPAGKHFAGWIKLDGRVYE